MLTGGTEFHPGNARFARAFARHCSEQPPFRADVWLGKLFAFQ